MKNKKNKLSFWILRLTWFIIGLMAVAVTIASIIALFRNGDAIYGLGFSIILVILTVVIFYLSEIWFIRNSSIKEVDVENDRVKMVYFNGKECTILFSNIKQISNYGNVVFYVTKKNIKINYFHNKGVFSTVLFDDNINTMLKQRLKEYQKINGPIETVKGLA